MNDRATPLTAINLSSSTKGQTNTTIPKERRRCTTVTAQIEVDVCSILVGTGKSILRTQRISICRAKVVDHHDD
jgi:hypothetical protein